MGRTMMVALGLIGQNVHSASEAFDFGGLHFSSPGLAHSPSP